MRAQKGQLHQGKTEKGQPQEPRTRIQPTTAKCRDCPASFQTSDPRRRRRLCDFCRWLHKRTIGNRASQKWWAKTSPEYRDELYRAQWYREKRRELRKRCA